MLRPFPDRSSIVLPAPPRSDVPAHLRADYRCGNGVLSSRRLENLADTVVRAAVSGKAAMKEDLEKQLSELVRRREDLQGQAQACRWRCSPDNPKCRTVSSSASN